METGFDEKFDFIAVDEVKGDLEGNVLLAQPFDAHRARVRAAVARVDDDGAPAQAVHHAAPPARAGDSI